MVQYESNTQSWKEKVVDRFMGADQQALISLQLAWWHHLPDLAPIDLTHKYTLRYLHVWMLHMQPQRMMNAMLDLGDDAITTTLEKMDG